MAGSCYWLNSDFKINKSAENCSPSNQICKKNELDPEKTEVK